MFFFEIFSLKMQSRNEIFTGKIINNIVVYNNHQQVVYRNLLSVGTVLQLTILMGCLLKVCTYMKESEKLPQRFSTGRKTNKIFVSHVMFVRLTFCGCKATCL